LHKASCPPFYAQTSSLIQFERLECVFEYRLAWE
jgi:hypothetical protein